MIRTVDTPIEPESVRTLHQWMDETQGQLLYVIVKAKCVRHEVEASQAATRSFQQGGDRSREEEAALNAAARYRTTLEVLEEIRKTEDHHLTKITHD
jgi:hypothetical protein